LATTVRANREVGYARSVRSDPPAGRLRRRVGLAVIDHGVSAGSNLAVTVVAARMLDATEFGAFAVSYLLYVVITGAIRALVSEPALVQAGGPVGWQRGMVAAGLFLALGAASVVAAIGIALERQLGDPLVVLAFCLPGLVAQDLGRYVAFAERRPERALRLDVLWAVAMGVGFTAVWSLGWETSEAPLLAWGVAGSMTGAFALRDSGVPLPDLDWIRRSWIYSWRYAVAFAVTAGITYMTTLLLGVIEDVRSVGTIRGVQVLYGPLNVLYAGLFAVLVTEGVAELGSSALRSRLTKVVVLLVAVAGSVTAFWYVAPSSFGRAVLGSSWAPAREVLVPAGMVAALGGVVAAANIGLRARRAVRENLAVQIQVAPVLLGAPLIGAGVSGVQGYMWALVGASVLSAGMWWRQLRLQVSPAEDPIERQPTW
jgi:O-antigen/teichoic acid export membrane protein